MEVTLFLERLRQPGFVLVGQGQVLGVPDPTAASILGPSLLDRRAMKAQALAVEEVVAGDDQPGATPAVALDRIGPSGENVEQKQDNHQEQEQTGRIITPRL